MSDPSDDHANKKAKTTDVVERKTKSMMVVLPIDLVEQILHRLDLGSWLRCKAVCKEWRKTLSIAKPPTTNYLPWLWFYSNPNHYFTDYHGFHKYRAVFPPEVLAKVTHGDFRCRSLGSFGAWLILMIEHNGRILCCFLFNPFSSSYISLPVINWRIIESDDYNFQARLSCVPNQQNLSSNQCMVAGFSYEDIHLCKPGDLAWRVVEYSFAGSGPIHDAVFHYGEEAGPQQLYVVDDDGGVVAFDVAPGNTLVQPESDFSIDIQWSEPIDREFRGEFKLVVNSSRQLLVIKKQEPDCLDEGYIITVYRLHEGKLVLETDLEGGMIFVGDVCSYYCPVPAPPSESKLFVKNSIYNLETNDDDDDLRHVLRRHTLDTSSSTFVGSTSPYDLGELNAPLWFFPVIRN